MASIPLSGPDQVSRYVVIATPASNDGRYCGETLTETVNAVSVLTCTCDSLEPSSDAEHTFVSTVLFKCDTSIF